MGSTHLPVIAGMSAAIRRDFDREQWTTCHIGSLHIGDVFSLPSRPLRPVVLTTARTESVPGDTYGWVIGEARDIATGEGTEFKLRANLAAPTRCDLHYTPNREAR